MNDNSQAEEVIRIQSAPTDDALKQQVHEINELVIRINERLDIYYFEQLAKAADDARRWRAKAESLEAELRSIRSSTTWKLSAPLRSLLALS
jgi:hypothetical protein